MINDPEKGGSETNPLLLLPAHLQTNYSQDSLLNRNIPSSRLTSGIGIGTGSGSGSGSRTGPAKWGATPEVRKGWAQQKSNARDLEVNSLPISAPLSLEIRLDGETDTDSKVNNIQRTAFACFSKLPGFLIAITLNLFLSMSFGAAFFPQHWQDNFPAAIPRSALGVQMFLFSTLICQVTMTTLSEFPEAMG